MSCGMCGGLGMLSSAEGIIGLAMCWYCNGSGKATSLFEEKLPEVKLRQTWKHTGGGLYTVRGFTNLYTSMPDKYPITVVYAGVSNGKVWSRPLKLWHRSMTLVE